MQKRVLDEDGNPSYTDRYLFVKLIACRTKQPKIVSFKHRFKDDNGMALIDDIHLNHPVSTNTEVDFIKGLNNGGQKTRNRQIIG